MDGPFSTAPIVVALFGTGNIGNVHLHNLLRNPRILLRYVVELQVKVVEDVLQKYRLPETTVLHPSQSQQVYGDTSVDGVIVCSPTHTHEAIIRAALSHGKGVFCEKPIASSLDVTESCYEQAERAGKPLLCAFNRRFDPSLKKIYEGIKSGSIGKVHTIKTCARDHPFPSLNILRISGGIFYDSTVHDIDYVCWLMGEYPNTVYTQAHAHVPEVEEMGDYDTVMVMMKFPSGAMASIDMSRSAIYGYDQRCEVFGSGGMLQSENHQATGVIHYDKTGKHSDPPKPSYAHRYAESYAAALDHFIDVIQGHATPEVTGEAAVMVCRIADACEMSARTGERVSLGEAST